MLNECFPFMVKETQIQAPLGRKAIDYNLI